MSNSIATGLHPGFGFLPLRLNTFSLSEIPSIVDYWESEQGIVLDSGVQQWQGILENNSAIQTTGSLQPAYVQNQLNGFPALQGDGVDDIMLTDVPAIDTSNGLTIFFVARNGTQTTGGSALRPVLGWEADNLFTIGTQRFTAQSEEIDFAIAATRIPIVPNSWPRGTWRIIAATYDGNTLTGYSDGELYGSVAASVPSLAANNLTFFGQTPTGSAANIQRRFKGELAAASLFGAVLDQEELAAVTSYYARKYRLN